ncbi:hypothetical protein [Streptomyces sp. CdTB01]|uniref:hypothetical protein n=1 Tax=Streptomyces sp. CdTB01 TaxID=1725411 RepID=UPI00073A9130|nr:hypothetical protein [Streptomyces sp. CdTB01]ALV33209.1 hypothetical protein AS200_15095 [Streptomyces sp. CdTB01]
MRELLYVLPALACPIGMGVMMWLMMRPHRDGAPKASGPSPNPPLSTDQPEAPHDVAALRKEIAGLRAELDRRSADPPAVERTP